MNTKHVSPFSVSALTLGVALGLFGSSSAFAAETSPPVEQDPLRGLRGLELTLRGSPGAASSDSPVQLQPGARVAGDPGALLKGTASPYGVGFVGQAMLGFRVHPLMSFGLRGGIRTSSASALDDGSTALSRSSWDAGFYLRAYPLALVPSVRDRFEPWFSVGAEYMRDTQTFMHPAATATGASVAANGTIDHHAVAVPIGIGVDYRIHPRIAIGPSFEYAFAIPVAGCASESAPGYSTIQYCSSGDAATKVLAANSYGVWSAGLDLRVTLF